MTVMAAMGYADDSTQQCGRALTSGVPEEPAAQGILFLPEDSINH